MYLTILNQKTGLVNLDDVNDGVLSIKCFRDLIEDKSLGLECFTCVAMTVDYKSPIRYFAFKERHNRAMREVTGDGKKYRWGHNQKIVEACIMYAELQYDPKIDELDQLNELWLSKLKSAKDEDDSEKKLSLIKKSSEVKKLIENILKGESRDSLLDNAPTKNGYKLSRLEIKVQQRKSFYHEQQKRESAVTAKRKRESAKQQELEQEGR